MEKLVRSLKIVWIYFWAALMTLVLFVPEMITLLFSSTGNLPFLLTKLWARVMLLVTGARVRIRGREKIEKNKSYVIISNHQSVFDILAIVTSIGIQYRWTIKREVLKIPLFGHALYAARNIFIDRSNPEKAHESIRKGLDRLPAGVSVMFFAEGTRSSDGRLLPFKKGGFVVALERNLPILPVTVNGSRRVLPSHSIVFTPGRIEVIVGDPIETHDFNQQSLPELMVRTRAVIESNLVLDDN